MTKKRRSKTMKKNSRNATKESSRNVVKESNSNAMKENSRNVAKESSRNAVKESSRNATKKNRRDRIKKIFEVINAHNTYVSIFALITSIITFCWTYSIQNRTLKFNTYNMDLSYQIKFSDRIDKGDISISQEHIQITAEEFLNVIPTKGGISKFGLVLPQPNFENDFAIQIINTYDSDIATFREAQDSRCTINTLTLPIFVEDDNSYYSSVIFIIEDYKHNFFSNLIVLEIDKKNHTNIDERIYDKAHLLLTLNETLGVIPDFDLTQLKRYSQFREKMDELNI